MSGPKGYQVSVESAEERARRQVAETRARCGRLTDQLAGLSAVAQGRVSACEEPRSQDLGALRSWEAALRAAVEEAEEMVGRERRESRLRTLGSGADPDSLGAVDLGLPGAGRAAGAPASRRRDAEEADRGRRAAGLIEAASEIEDKAALEALTARIRSLRSLDGAALVRESMMVADDVARAVRRQRTAVRCRREAEAEALSLAHLSGPTVEDLRRRAREVTRDSEVAALREEVSRVLADAERQADAAFVTAQASAVLADLGYVVDDPFEVVDQADVVVARSRDLPRHALRLRVNRASGTMLTSVIAQEGTTPEADADAEARTCADVVALTSALADRGVRAEQVFHRRPGEVPVEHALEPGAHRAGAAGRTRRTRGARTMEHRS